VSDFNKSKLTFGYMMAMAAVASVLITMVFVYFLLILVALAVWGAGDFFGLFSILDQDDLLVMVLGGMALIVFNVIMLLFVISLFKPIFSRRAYGGRRVWTLNRHEETKLFTLVENIARQIGAPIPKRIQTDMDANASASFKGGIFGLLTRSMVLTIGLPMVSAHDARELAGIIAHELGHFSQGGAMRLSYLIMTITNWFCDIVYTKDSWDQGLERTIENWGIFAVIPWFVKLVWWVVKKFLWIFASTSRILAFWLTRQMEFDADYYGTLIAGTDSYASTMERSGELEASTEFTYHDIERLWREQERMVESLPEQILANRKRLPEEVRKVLEGRYHDEQIHLFSTHPTLKERIARIHRLDAPGIDLPEGPASQLFQDFNSLAKERTQEIYRKLIGARYRESAIAKTVEIVQQAEAESKASKATTRYFQGLFDHALIPILLPRQAISAQANVEEIKEKIEDTRDYLEEYSSVLTESRSKFCHGWNNIFEAEAMIVLYNAKAIVPEQVQKKKFKSLNHCEGALRNAHIKRRESKEFLDPYLTMATDRFVYAFHLLSNPEVRSLAEGKGVDVEKAKLYNQKMSEVGFVMDMIEGLHSTTTILSVLLGHYSKKEENIALNQKIHEYIKKCHQSQIHLQQSLEPHSYPFEHAAGNITMARYALPEMPHPYDLEGMFNASERTIDNILTLYFRLLGEMVTIAEKVEEALGFEPLCDPEQVDLESASGSG
jgi:Zn-dependent protease with chaperone function